MIRVGIVEIHTTHPFAFTEYIRSCKRAKVVGYGMMVW